MSPKPTFFRTPQALRRWFATHHRTAVELWVGFHRLSTGRGGITYPEALDEALCYGWIDGLRKKLDETSYIQRFSPRKPRSIWSLVNITKVEALIAGGRMHESGLAAFRAREAKRSGVYSFENRPKRLEARLEKTFRANTKAWTFFTGQPPGYQRVAIWFVMSAKQDATRDRRLATLMRDSAAGRRLGLVTDKATDKEPGPQMNADEHR